MIETGLHYHLGIKYQGQYKDGLEDGTWTMTLNDVLCSTCEFKKGMMDGEMKIYNEDTEIICLLVYTKGEKVDTLGDIINVKEIERVIELLGNKMDDLWKIGDVDALKECKGEGYLLSYKALEKLSKE